MIKPIEINTAKEQPFRDLFQDNFIAFDLIDFTELKDQDLSFKETHEKLCREWSNLDEQMELEWKKVHADFENWHNDFTEIPAFG